MTEKERFELLGLDWPGEEGENEREPAEPAPADEPPAEADADDADSPEVEEEPDDAPEAEDVDPEGTDEPAGETEETPANERVQSKAERARQAAARRRREVDAAVAEALRQEREAVDAELKASLDWAGIRDGDKPIETMQQLRDYRLRSELRSGNLTPETLREVVQQELSGSRTVRPAETPTRDEAFETRVREELVEIGKYDPNIRTVEDLLAMDRAEEFLDEVKNHNHTFLEAYRIVNADKIAEAKARSAAATAAKQAKNSVLSKQHMRQTAARGTGDVTVPQSFMDRAAALMPKSTPEERRKYYQKYAKTQS